ncbi:hypothetical protein KAW38_03420 [Candidatus Micrarchaeota archaeon]|nr:hypothetical protein [Candidatus Micrarchaeota archaeon]
MKRVWLLLVFILLFNVVTIGNAVPDEKELEESLVQFKQKTEGLFESEDKKLISPLMEFLLDWKTIAILGVLIMTSLITLTYTIAISFNIPELRAWADVELSEAISSVLIITLIMGAIVFAGGSVENLMCNDVNFAHKDYCSDTNLKNEFMVSSVALDYVNLLIGTTEDLYFDLLEENLEMSAQAQETRTVGVVYQMFLNFAFSGKFNPHLSIYSEKFQQELQSLDGILFSVNSQKFLLESISMVVAPLLIMLGAILRSFFLTRKTGGLLIATGIGFLLVLPATYVLSSYTIKTTVYGAESISGGSKFSAVCPKACKIIPPAGFDSKKSYSYSKMIDILYEDPNIGEEDVKAFLNGTIRKVIVTTLDADDVEVIKEYTSCQYYDADPEDDLECDISCRELPFPTGIDFCMYQRESCANMPEECKIVRKVKGDIPIYELGGQIDEDDLEGYLPNADEVMGEGFKEIVTTTGLCREECRSIPPLKVDCNKWCPSQCLYQYSDGEVNPDCRNACGEDGRDKHGNCKNNDHPCRELYHSASGKDLIKDNLVKPEDTCVEIIPTLVREKGHISALEGGCYECIYLFDSGFRFTPQIHTDCATLCGGDYGGSSPVYLEDLDVTMNKIDGFVGPSDIKSVSKLMIPAYILPIFNLVITFMFIQTLSPLIGGDVNIPGLMRAI